MHAKITDQIWEDPHFMELGDSEKLAVFWLITKANGIGFVEISERKFRRDIEAPYEVLHNLSKHLGRTFVMMERGIWMRNYIRRQFGSGTGLQRSNMAKSLHHLLASADSELKTLILQEYPELNTSEQAPSKVLLRSSQGPREGEGEGEGEGEEGGAGGNKPSPDLIRWSPTTGWTGITPATLSQWASTYPACDIDRQLRAAHEWLLSNPAKARKSAWRRFATNWLARSQEKGGDLRSHPSGPEKKEGWPPPEIPLKPVVREAEFPWREYARHRNGEDLQGSWEHQGPRTRKRLRAQWAAEPQEQREQWLAEWQRQNPDDTETA